ncbi:hypothetical protein [Myxacorys almedinensis]|uniref:Uncharacterized protein n=1 Tax=Myxacorys almedinensis A TaxID=2690445 RepID=A0A8J7Z001_9CYAN|nr:hypothetical protein [Myxacorys almedinensis]NDJ17199.1 hypothetical protein [Myxacorys almedinensis A]
MNHYCDQWISDWCADNGWTEWFRERSSYWAFPPNAVMPVPIPPPVLRAIKVEKGLSVDERLWCLIAIAVVVLGVLGTFLLASPMPLVVAFVFSAIAVARLEDDEMLDVHPELYS